MKVFEMKMRLIAPLAVMYCLLGIGSQVAQAQITYTNDTNIADFTAGITSYAMLSNFNNSDECVDGSSFTPTSSELAATPCRVYNLGTPTAVTGLPATNNWILATFSGPVSTIVVFPNIDHYGFAYDGYQYQIYGSNNYGSAEPTWTQLFDAQTVNGGGEPFTLGTFTGTPPSTVNNVETGGCRPGPVNSVGSNCVGYEAQFSFGTAYKYYAFGASTMATGTGNAEQELSAVGASSSSTQTQTLGGPGTQTIYTFGADNYKITGLNNQGGEQLTVTAFPIPKSSFPTGETGIPGFTGETCIPYGDYSIAAGNVDTCVEFQVYCQVSATDTTSCNFNYLLATSYDLPADLPAVGGPDFLVAHGVFGEANGKCPLKSTSMVQSIFTSYSAMRLDPTTRGTSGGPSCFVATYTPGAPIVTGTVSRSQFVGWESPVVDSALNQVKAGSTRPLKFQYFDTLGNPVTNLTLCPNLSGTGCTTPWVNFTPVGIACPNGTPINTATDTTLSVVSNSGLLNQGGGNYQLNWKTQRLWQGSCANILVTFDSGLVVTPATIGFQFN